MRHAFSAVLTVAAISVTASVSASEGIDDIVKMQRSGVSSDVLIAFVETSPVKYALNPDEIQQLEDAGVPATVIVTMLDKGRDAGAPPTNADAAPGGGAVATGEFEENTDNSNALAYAPAAENADVSTFYETLAPYGDWSQDEDAGYVWTPTVSADWSPYVDNGHWIYTDNGWYFDSGYAWGWAPFHYGRWSRIHDRWAWAPDVTWGPAWVTWRGSEDVYGWAPMPFGSHFDAGLGFSYHDRHFGFGGGLDFGLGAGAYAFVPANAFLAVNLRGSVYHHDRNNEAFTRTRALENTYNVNGNVIVNNGVPRNEVAARTGREIEPVHVQSANVAAGQPIPRTTLNGNQLTAFRPVLQNRSSVDPQVAIQRGREAAREQRAINQQQHAAARTDQLIQRRETAQASRLTEEQARARLAQERGRLMTSRTSSDVNFNRQERYSERLNAIDQREAQREANLQERQADQQAIQEHQSEQRQSEQRLLQQRQVDQHSAIQERQNEQRQQVQERQVEQRQATERQAEQRQERQVEQRQVIQERQTERPAQRAPVEHAPTAPAEHAGRDRR